MLKIENLIIRNQANETLVNLSLEIEQGEILALVGESGSGKSLTALSILRLLARGLTVSPEAKIVLGNVDLLTLSEKEMNTVRAREIGFVFQDPITSLNPVQTIETQIAEKLIKSGWRNRKTLREKIIELLNEVNIPQPEKRLKQYPHQLSGGLNQRVILAMALAGDPMLLILDEPTTALDVTTQQAIIKDLKLLQAKRGVPMLFITHDLALASQLATHVKVLKKGTEQCSQPAADFFKSPNHPYAKALLEATPHFASTYRVLQEAPVILKVEDLAVAFYQGVLFKKKKTFGLDNIGFSLRKGETLAIVGESGSGKTTIAKCLGKLIRPTAGRIHFESKKSKVQMIFQNPYSAMNPRFKIGPILEEGLLLAGMSRNKRKEKALIWLEKVSLPENYYHRYPHELSGGERQRIALARSLMVEPDVVILDEPTSALDVMTAKEMLDLLIEMQRLTQVSFVFITHHMALVEKLAHSVMVLTQGRCLEYGKVEQVLKAPRAAYTRNLLQAVPDLPK